MNYTPLYKKFFITSDNAKSEYESLINSPSTIQFDICIGKYPFFVNINHEILKLTEEIYSLNSQIIKTTYCNQHLPKLLIKSIVNHTLIEEICMTNQIEGIVSTRKEIKELLSGKEPKNYKRLYGMVNKYKELTQPNDSNKLMTPFDVRDLYNKTFIKDIEKQNIPDGKLFRKEAVDVTASELVIHSGMNPEEKIIQTMNQALDILNNQDLSLLVRIAIFHYLFGYIHPFYDGNGRMARLISSDYMKEDLDILCALQLSVACKHNQKKYYESFKVTNDIRNYGDLTYFVISFLEIIKSGLISLKAFIEEKISQYLYYEKIIRNLKIKDLQLFNLLSILLQNYLFDTTDLTIETLVQILNISPITLKSKMASSKINELIKIDKSNKAFHYSLNFEALQKME